MQSVRVQLVCVVRVRKRAEPVRGLLREAEPEGGACAGVLTSVGVLRGHARTRTRGSIGAGTETKRLPADPAAAVRHERNRPISRMCVSVSRCVGLRLRRCVPSSLDFSLSRILSRRVQEDLQPSGSWVLYLLFHIWAGCSVISGCRAHKGEQLKAIKAYLEAHPDIKWVWFDYSSMPQGDNKTVMEKAEFQLMLAAIADLYLTAHVLILLDGSYKSRFWTLTEAWCSMQTVTPDGLRPATKAERRYTIKCIHTADEKHDVAGLVEKVSKKTPDQMFDHLSHPDVNVTNAKDKVAMLPVIKKTNEHVIETFQKLVILPEPEPAVATAAQPHAHPW